MIDLGMLLLIAGQFDVDGRTYSELKLVAQDNKMRMNDALVIPECPGLEF